MKQKQYLSGSPTLKYTPTYCYIWLCENIVLTEFCFYRKFHSTWEMGIFWKVVLVKFALNESALSKELVYTDRCYYYLTEKCSFLFFFCLFVCLDACLFICLKRDNVPNLVCVIFQVSRSLFCLKSSPFRVGTNAVQRFFTYWLTSKKQQQLKKQTGNRGFLLLS